MDLITDVEHLQCTKCGNIQPVTEFYKDKSRKTGYRAWCKTCQKAWKRGYYEENQEELREYTRQWALLNPERKRAMDEEYRRTHKDELSEYFKRYREEHREIILDNQWLYHLRRRYKMTPDEYVAMLIAQDGKCAICKQPPAGDKRLHVDHDHSCCPGGTTCGKCVRRLLCMKCNNGLGLFNDDIELMLLAISYLEEFAHIKESQAA